MLKRFSVSLDSGLLSRFDEYIRRRSYNNRSEAIRDLIRNALILRDWEEDRNVIGVISLVYNHDQPQLQKRITTAQHNSHEQIVSTTHVHIDHDNCLEVIIVKGNAGSVTRLADDLAALRGVRNCSLSTSGTGDEDPPHHAAGETHHAHV